MDPLLPINPGTPAPPQRRVARVDRLPRITREGDRPERDPEERRAPGEGGQDDDGEQPSGGAHVDVRV